MKRIVMNKNVFLTMMVLFVLAGCWTSEITTAKGDLKTVQTRKDSCIATSRQLSVDATLAGKTGSYQLTLVEVAHGRDSRSVRGMLTLWKQVEGLETWSNASTPLYGFTDVDVKSVGAYRVGSLISEDPAAPGVLVIEGNYSGELNIILRLGSIANQRDLKRYDGAYTVLEVHKINADGFAGSWRSGKFGSRTKGYFCAKKLI